MGNQSDSYEKSSSRIIVVGGGLAGIAATQSALSLGYNVTLIEKRPYLGGRAYSFIDSETQLEVDNGQHVFLGCCTYYRKLLKTLGVENLIALQKTLKAEIFLNGKKGVLYSTPLLGPLHLLPALIGYRHISLVDKISAVYCMLQIRFSRNYGNSSTLENVSFYDWLKKRHQSEKVISNLWNLIILPTLNDDIRDVSASMGLMAIKQSILDKPESTGIGLAKVGLTSITGTPGQQNIEKCGGEVVLGKTVESLTIQDQCVSGVKLSDGTNIKADACILAVPYSEISQILPCDSARDPFFSNISKLTSSPIIGIHIWYDRAVMNQQFAAFLDSPIQWIFNRTLIQDLDLNHGQYVCISVSAAWNLIDESKEKLRELFAKEMLKIFPKAKNAKIQRFLVIKQPKATFRAILGASNHRPTQNTPINNLFLAGDYTQTGWPSTMEGAVRSGIMAVRCLTSQQNES